ncbi:MAG: hypothetical protein ACK518_01445 [bacterium]
MRLKVETGFKSDEVIPVGLRLSLSMALLEFVHLLGFGRKENFRENYFDISTAAYSVY